MLNMKPSRRPAKHVMDEPAEHVLLYLLEARERG
jgi:hypothetical protein